MARRLLVSLACVLLVSIVAPASAAPFANFSVIGTDPEGDAIWPIAPGVDEPAGQFDRKRVDILAVEAAVEGNAMQLRMIIGTTPKGTASYMYAIEFSAGGTAYVVCWTGTYANSEHQTDAEDTAGCSRFVGATRVGPAKLAAGVMLEEGPTSFIGWEFTLGAINAKIGDPLTDIVATTWIRGPANSGGGTAAGQLVFNQADRGPDAESYAYIIEAGGGGASPATIALTPADANATTPPGGEASFSLAFTVNGTLGNGSTQVNFTADGLPPGASLSTTSTNVTGNTTVEVKVATNETLLIGEYPFVLTADAGPGRTASANLTLVVTFEKPATTTPSQATSGTTKTTTETKKEEKDKGLPPVGASFLLAALAALVILVRRRGSA